MSVSTLESGLNTKLRELVRTEYNRLRNSGKRFGVIHCDYKDDFDDFVDAVTAVANEDSPPPEAISPYYGESRGRSVHEIAISAGVIITF